MTGSHALYRVQMVEDAAGELQIWDHPIDGRDYVVGGDVAEGKQRDKRVLRKRSQVSYHSDRPDYSCAVVLDMETCEHVATWHGYVPPEHFALVLAGIGIYFNSALIVPELNGPGLAVVTRLQETLSYPNLYRSRMLNVLDMDPLQAKLGFKTDVVTRPWLMSLVSETVNSGTWATRDKGLVSELRTMEYDDMGVPRARGKNKDDRVFAFALALEGRYSYLGMSAEDRAKKKSSPSRAYDAQVWANIKRKQEARARGTQRARGGDGVGGLHAGWSRGHWPGRGRMR